MYRVLYRKWRPQVFSDVVGQPQVTKTLSSQVRENRLAHAYLFTGSRGTGKTTCAKIFSKAVNCLNPKDGNPCNECEICRGIDRGTVLDIVEIDAASNRGIDDIRLLRDEANFTPSQAKYRVYIIDEVHMLTIEAFNALLKTLEEPPEHVKFILATTEVQKLPSTILSRCQRFDFRRIEPDIIADRLIEVATAEKTTLERDAAILIARISDGGMRDALSLLDRALSVTENVDIQTVSACAGLMGREHLYALIRAVADKDTAKCLNILDELHKASCDTERLCTELIDQFRSFLMIKTVQHPENLIVCTAEELETIKGLSNMFTSDFVMFALNVLTNASQAIKKTQNRRIEAEIALIRMCRPEGENDVSALNARIAQLEKEIALLRSGSFIPSQPSPVSAPVPKTEEKKAEDKKADIPWDIPGEIPAPADVPWAPPEEIPLPSDVPWDAPEEIPSPADVPWDIPEAPKPGEKKQTSSFSGFAAEASGISFADKFAAADNGKDDSDDAFDFDAFMAELEDEKAQQPPSQETKPSQSFSFAADMPFGSSSPSAGMPFGDEGASTDASQINPSTWMKIILETEKAFMPLIGQLTGSRGYIEGNSILIEFADPTLKKFANTALICKHVKNSASFVLNKEYNVKIK